MLVLKNEAMIVASDIQCEKYQRDLPFTITSAAGDLSTLAVHREEKRLE